MEIRGPIEPEMVEHRILRRIAILGIGFGVIGVVQLGWAFWRRPVGSFFSRFQAPGGSLVSLSEMLITGGSVVLLVSAIALFRWRGWGRVVLMIWGLVCGIAMILNRAAMTSAFIGTPNYGGFNVIVEMSQGLTASAFPLCVLLMLRRREFRDVFASDAGRGFEVLQTDLAPRETLAAPMPVEAIPEHDTAGTVARIVAGVGMAMAILHVVLQVWVSYRNGFQNTFALRIWLGVIGLPLDVLFRVSPILLLIGSLALLRRREWGRPVMLLWAVCHILAGVMYWGFNVAQLRARSATQPVGPSVGAFALDVAFSFTAWHAFGVVVLMILWGLRLRGDADAAGPGGLPINLSRMT